ncbi:hypothetical protein T492DRAFT_906670, partial [Pavlovales sp. CCMP2436]
RGCSSHGSRRCVRWCAGLCGRRLRPAAAHFALASTPTRRSSLPARARCTRRLRARPLPQCRPGRTTRPRWPRRPRRTGHAHLNGR